MRKEPWQMTQAQFIKAQLGKTYKDFLGREIVVTGAPHEVRQDTYYHEYLVRQALAENKSVPSKVLADYHILG